MALAGAALALLASASSALAASEVGEFLHYYSKPWTETCATGKAQTPINLPAQADTVPQELVPTFTFPTAEGVYVQNTGFALQVGWQSIAEGAELPTLPSGGDSLTAVITDPSTPITKQVKVQPLQFHWHAVSEHAVDGMLYAAEVHIVSVVAQGEAPEWGCDEFWATPGGTPNFAKCVAVFGVMYKIGETSPDYLSTWIGEMPRLGAAKVNSTIATFDIGELVPEDKSFYTYYGSLTTPPCAEGLRWHVFKTPQTISAADLGAMEMAVANTYSDAADPTTINNYRHNNRDVQPLNNRTVWEWEDPAGEDVAAQEAGSVAGAAVATSSARALLAVAVPAAAAALGALLL